MRGWVALGLLLGGCDGGDSDVDPDRVDAVLALTGDPVAGENVYQANCRGCHADAGSFAAVPAAAQASAVIDGVGSMPSFGGLEDQAIADLLAYIAGS